jgi:hypothetical protein
LPYRDTNGFRRLIVVLTGPGKLFGLHSGDGRILWASTIAAAGSNGGSSGSKGGSKQYLRLWRRFHDLTHAPQVVVLTTEEASCDVHVMNAHTGQQLQHEQLPYAVDKVGRVLSKHFGMKQSWVNAFTAAGASVQGLRSGCLCKQCLRKAWVRLTGRGIALDACTAVGSCTQVLFVARVPRLVLNEHVALWRDTDTVQQMVAWLVCMCTVRLLAEGDFSEEANTLVA